MAIIVGVNIPDNKRVEISLTSIYGIGLVQSKLIVQKAGIENNPRVRELSESDLNRLREIVDSDTTVEGDLRREVNTNIRRLIEIGCYRGSRHRRSLPTRGQRTRTNARSRRGPRRAVAGRKAVVVK